MSKKAEGRGQRAESKRQERNVGVWHSFLSGGLKNEN